MLCSAAISCPALDSRFPLATSSSSTALEIINFKLTRLLRTRRRRDAFCVKGERSLFLSSRLVWSRASERASPSLKMRCDPTQLSTSPSAIDAHQQEYCPDRLNPPPARSFRLKGRETSVLLNSEWALFLSFPSFSLHAHSRAWLRPLMLHPSRRDASCSKDIFLAHDQLGITDAATEKRVLPRRCDKPPCNSFTRGESTLSQSRQGSQSVSF